MLVFMVRYFLCFLHRKTISLTVIIDNFINQAKCEYKAIFEIHGFLVLWLVHKLDENLFGLHLDTDSSWVPLVYHKRDYCLAKKTKPPKWNHVLRSFYCQIPPLKRISRALWALISTLILRYGRLPKKSGTSKESFLSLYSRAEIQKRASLCLNI